MEVKVEAAKSYADFSASLTAADMACEETRAKNSSSGLRQMRSEMNRTGNE